MGQFRDDYRVLEISQKGLKAYAIERQRLLEKVAKQVQPVMRKHRWTVKVLSELPPTSTGRLWGLNYNSGSEIKIRLIEFGSKDQYLPYEAIIGTMLHELCHNDIGPHNAQFYKLLDDITLLGDTHLTSPVSNGGHRMKLHDDVTVTAEPASYVHLHEQELEDFMAKGIIGTGEGFDAPSVGRLGGSGFGAHNPSPTELRSKMVQAAEARAKRLGLMPSGSRKLGGALTHLKPREAAAIAAERRARDDAGCACGAKGGTSFTEAEVIELESQPSSAVPRKQSGTRESDAQQLGNAEHQSAIGARAHGQNGTGTGSEAAYHQRSVRVELRSGFADRHVHQQRGGIEEKRQSEHQQEQLIDLSADSDPEPEVID